MEKNSTLEAMNKINEKLGRIVELTSHKADEAKAVQQPEMTEEQKITYNLKKLFFLTRNEHDMKVQLEQIKQTAAILGNVETMETVGKAVANISAEEIKEMDLASVNDIIGELEIGDNIADEEELVFKKGFITFAKDLVSDLDSVEASIKVMTDGIKEASVVMTEVNEKYGDITGFIKSKYQATLDNSETSLPVKENIKKAMAAIEDAVELKRVFDCYAPLKPENTVRDYKDVRRRKSLSNQYIASLRKMRMHSDISVFTNIERTFLEEKYHKYNGFFAFLIIKMMAHKHESSLRFDDGTFLSQLNIVLMQLFTDTLSEERKEKFLNNVRNLLDRFLV